MSEPTTSVVISVAILAVLALFVPCIDSLANLLRRNAQKRVTEEDQSAESVRRENA